MIKVISLTISLDNWKPRIWRRLWLKDTTNLKRVCEILYTSMGWDGYNLSEIQTKNASYGSREVDPPDNLLDWKKFTLADIVGQNITQFKFLYDFGDNWRMTVKIKRELDLNSDAPYPVCVNGENAAPPEDVGGLGGYEKLLQAMKHPGEPKDDWEKELLEWVDEDFDPNYFSVDEVNERLEEV